MSERRHPGSDLDARLRAHLSAAADRLTDPPDRLEAVQARARRRQAVRGTLVAVALAALVAVPVLAGVLDRPSVVIQPGPTEPTPTGQPTPEREPSPPTGPTPSPGESPPEGTPHPDPGVEPAPGIPQEPGTLQAPLLGYGGAPGDRLELLDRGTDPETLWPDPVALALPDGQGGVLVQPADADAIVWLPEAGADPVVRLVEVDGHLLLRELVSGTSAPGLPDGTHVLYSVRPAEPLSEADVEEFFTVELEAGATPQRIAVAGAFETWTVGPVIAAGGQAVHASCHLHCSLWAGLPGETQPREALYHGGGSEAGPAAAIEGLTATADGNVLGFVEYEPVVTDLRSPELVLLDGASFEVLARVPLPLPEGTRPATPTLSLSADGQRALVTLGGETSGAPPVDVPRIPFAVHGALTADPLVLPVAFEGVLRWADPVAAAGIGGPVTEAERAAAEALIDFADDPAAFGVVPLAAEVSLGLGEDLLGPPRTAAELADPEHWRLEPEEGHFRALVGPFSALDVLAGSGQVTISGGPHARCAAAPIALPPEVEGLRQVSVQRRMGANDSCLQWWAVDLFLTGDGEIAAVTLDLWEP